MEGFMTFDAIEKAIKNDTIETLADDTTIDEIDKLLNILNTEQDKINQEQAKLDEKKKLLYTLYGVKKKIKDADVSTASNPKRKRTSTRSTSTRKTKS
jgi:hypothetical protein